MVIHDRTGSLAAAENWASVQLHGSPCGVAYRQGDRPRLLRDQLASFELQPHAVLSGTRTRLPDARFHSRDGLPVRLEMSLSKVFTQLL
jgi:hypothetical protein